MASRACLTSASLNSHRASLFLAKLSGSKPKSPASSPSRTGLHVRNGIDRDGTGPLLAGEERFISTRPTGSSETVEASNGRDCDFVTWTKAEAEPTVATEQQAISTFFIFVDRVL